MSRAEGMRGYVRQSQHHLHRLNTPGRWIFHYSGQKTALRCSFDTIYFAFIILTPGYPSFLTRKMAMRSLATWAHTFRSTRVVGRY